MGIRDNIYCHALLLKTIITEYNLLFISLFSLKKLGKRYKDQILTLWYSFNRMQCL